MGLRERLQARVWPRAVMTPRHLERFGDAWATADVAGLMSFMTEGCVYFASAGPEPGTTYRGRDEVSRGFTEMLAYDKGRERHGGACFILGNLGVAEWSFEERAPHGRTILVRGCDIFEFVGDKIRKKDAFRKVFDQIGGPV